MKLKIVDQVLRPAIDFYTLRRLLPRVVRRSASLHFATERISERSSAVTAAADSGEGGIPGSRVDGGAAYEDQNFGGSDRGGRAGIGRPGLVRGGTGRRRDRRERQRRLRCRAARRHRVAVESRG